MSYGKLRYVGANKDTIDTGTRSAFYVKLEVLTIDVIVEPVRISMNCQNACNPWDWANQVDQVLQAQKGIYMRTQYDRQMLILPPSQYHQCMDWSGLGQILGPITWIWQEMALDRNLIFHFALIIKMF